MLTFAAMTDPGMVERSASFGTPEFTYPLLVADIGGTNARFGLLAEPTADMRILGAVKTDEHESFQEAFHALPDSSAHSVSTILIALAAPVRSGPIPLTNCDWIVEPDAILGALNARHIACVNDFEALALALPGLGGSAIREIAPGTKKQGGAKIVLGPGTGLGVAGLVMTQAGWRPLPSEAGHIGFGPIGAEERRLWSELERENPWPTAETLVSGPGLLRLYRAYAVIQGRDPRVSDAAGLSDAARAGDDTAEAALDLFVTLLGRFARAMALTFIAEGGVFLAGGVTAALADRISGSRFRTAFRAGPVHRPFLERIPVALVTDPFPAFAGLADLARRPESFALDLSDRSVTASGTDK
ncbi:MAG: glucokinase [Pseudomonadota bacterium]